MESLSKLLVFLIVIGAGLWSLDAVAGKPGSGGTSYAGQNLGALPGDRSSAAWDVNGNGRVVGDSDGELRRAFYWDGTMHDISPAVDALAEPVDSSAMAISGGATEYAVGYETTRTAGAPVSHALIWTSPPGSPEQLDAEPHCQAYGINDAGTWAVGYCPDTLGVIWTVGQTPTTRTDIPLPEDYSWGSAEDVNDQGIVVGVKVTSGGVETAYLRLANGDVVDLPPATDDVASVASAVSNVLSGNIVHVAGSTITDPNGFRSGHGIRWTVNLGTRAVVSQVLSQAGAEGVNDAGDVAGTTNSTSRNGRTSKQLATLWRAGAYVSLKAPKGGTDSASHGQSQDYVVGESTVGGARVATRWAVN